MKEFALIWCIGSSIVGTIVLVLMTAFGIETFFNWLRTCRKCGGKR